MSAVNVFAQYPDLQRLKRGIGRSQGLFSLFFAECNLPILRTQLAEELIEQIQPSPIIVDLAVIAQDTDYRSIDELINQQVKGLATDAAIFLFGLEQLLPTLSTNKLRATVQQLNWRRSGLARLQRPLVIWLPRYALDLLAEQTPDFYDWYSGIYCFEADQSQRQSAERAAFQSLWSRTGVHAADFLSHQEKKRWLGSLKELLQEHLENDASKAALLGNLAYLLSSMGDKERALVNYHESLAIRQEIGDKSGEGTTLNNISQIYDARGDYETALNYLKQSLAIQQEIGDKSGEGTTLNNISQIYDARGDYETALNYLKQSLAIQQEIGDKSGLCVTLFNMGHIQKQNGQLDEARVTWTKVYKMAKQMELAQVLEALERLAPVLGLDGGLAAWDALANHTQSGVQPD